MNNAEEIVDETEMERKMKSDIASVVNYFEESDLTDEELINLSADMKRIAKQHTNQTLQELKDKVDGEQYDSDWGSEGTEYYRGYNDAIKEIITLIDEAIND